LKEHILIVDDHPVVLDGIHLLLNTIRPEADFITTTSGLEALTTIQSTQRIDWMFVDINLPDIHGLDLLKAVKASKLTCKVIVLSSEMKIETIDQALLLGVDGVLSKSFSKKIFELCLMTIDLGKIFLTAEHANELKYYRDSLADADTPLIKEVTKRQHEILCLLDKGMPNKVISTQMGISESTVKSHVSSLMTTLEANNRTHCVVKAREKGII